MAERLLAALPAACEARGQELQVANALAETPLAQVEAGEVVARDERAVGVPLRLEGIARRGEAAARLDRDGRRT